MKTYRTSEIAALIGVHPNTVRFYEEVGFITPPKRLNNGYRAYTELHLQQLRLVRLALRAQVLQNGLRKQVLHMLRLCAALDMQGALEASQRYKAMLEAELASAQRAIANAETILYSHNEDPFLPLRRQQAARALNITSDTLRNWELNGLISVKRRQNGYRIYNERDMQRLRIIRTLRLADYSLSAILRLLNRLDKDAAAPLGKTLDTPEPEEDVISVCDRLITSLENTLADADSIHRLLLEIEAIKAQTLQ